ncbi:branched-chain amino acid ABC transporter permease [Thalassiella azotivora]
MDVFLSLTFQGLSRGAVYAAFAIALVIIWRAARVINFAQGAMAVAAAYVAWSVTTATGSYWLGLAAALLSGAVIGLVVERGLMRFVSHENPLNDVIVALGLVLVLQAVTGMLFGNDYRPYPKPVSDTAVQVGSVALPSPYTWYVVGSVVLLVAVLGWLLTRTPLGLRMRAAAFSPEVSRLLGVDVRAMLTLGWVLASAVGALAAVLVVPTELGLNPHSMDLVFVSAFTAAVVGGLESLPGAVVGGLAVGLLTAYVNGYVGSSVAPMAVLVLLLAVLLVRPGGLFSPVAARQV